MSVRYPRDPVAPRWILFLSWLLTRRVTLKPIYRSVICNDLFGQAEHLRESGYYVASVAVARCWLERAINRLTLITPNWQTLGKSHRHFKGFVQFLEVEGVIETRLADTIRSCYDNASGIIHGKETNSRKTAALISTAQGIRKRLENATIVALSRTNDDEGDPTFHQLMESPVVMPKIAELETVA